MISAHRHEYGDRLVIGRLELQLFEPRLWRWWPLWRAQWERNWPEPYGDPGPITGWVVALPTLAIRWRWRGLR